MRFLKLSLIAITLFFALSSCNKYGKIMKSKDVAYKLSMADKFFEEKNYRQAQLLYEELYPVYKGTDKFEELYYKDAYCFYYLKNYSDAENFFKGFLEVFPNSSKAEEVDFMHAMCFYKQVPKVDLDQTNTAKSIGVMQSFINTHPGSSRIAEATEIIDKSRERLEIKELRAADLYFKVGQYRAAAISYGNLLSTYPESKTGDRYKLNAIKSYYRFAKLSVPEKQTERFEKVISEYQDFEDRFPESPFLAEAKELSNLSQNNIKEIQYEQIKTTTKL
ncbi:MAG: outer membrane protein assembly factor BamD [Ferruginibacter sp.]|nr:outer membrane protein assembly factor BamD [Ferruginibacter sp.]